MKKRLSFKERLAQHGVDIKQWAKDLPKYVEPEKSYYSHCALLQFSNGLPQNMAFYLTTPRRAKIVGVTVKYLHV